MREKKIIVLFFILFFMASTSFSGVCKYVAGNTFCGNGTMGRLIKNGMVSLRNTLVKGATEIKGYLSAKDSIFKTLNIDGSANLINCIIKSNTVIRGLLLADSTIFESKVDIYSNSVNLINSQILGDLRMFHTKSKKSKKQKVYLDKNSEVFGDVIFDDGEGVIILKSGSKINAKVIGGRIIKQ